MSKIMDMIIKAEESEDERLEKWRENTRKMYELAEQWNGVYSTIDGVVGKVRYIKGKENEHR